MAQFDFREMHLVKKALALGIAAIERAPEQFKACSDMEDMKELLARLIPSDAEMESYAKSAHGVFGER